MLESLFTVVISKLKTTTTTATKKTFLEIYSECSNVEKPLDITIISENIKEHILKNKLMNVIAVLKPLCIILWGHEPVLKGVWDHKILVR